ncbi:hypothetical protein MP228_001254 [Amoeboaphelidium protococcarum]|nr:hypothetical protein MP228_001254 [Amoeboaphelidium protococcarum]
MYNGIGLPTPRGTGTSGHVQKNLSNLKPRHSPYHKSIQNAQDSKSQIVKRDTTNSDLLEHERKRNIELKCVELREQLEDEGTLNEAQIDEQVKQLRAQLKRQLVQADSAQNPLDQQLESQRVMVKNKRFADALNIQPSSYN